MIAGLMSHTESDIKAPEAPETLVSSLGFEWLIHLRWVAIVGLLVAIVLAHWFGLLDDVLWPLVVTAGLLAFNVWRQARWRAYPEAMKHTARAERRACLEIHVDLVALTLMIHLTGGADNPFVMFYVFHVAIASILLTTWRALLIGGSAVVLFGSTLLLEHSGVVVHNSIPGLEPSQWPINRDLIVWIAVVMTLGVTIYFLQLLVRRQRRAELRRREHERIALSRERLARIGEIAAGVAHNIRNPLHGALNCLDLLRSGAGNEETYELLDEALRRMERVTNRLLKLTREHAFRPARLHLSPEIRDALRFARARIGQDEVKLAEDLDDTIEVRLDPDRFHEALVNILDNSVDACVDAGGGAITVRSRREDGGVRIDVEDTGIGFDGGQKGKVFDPFFTTKPIGEGSGLGLAIARRAIEQHRGRIEFQSASGKGTTVSLFLPIAVNSGMVE